MKKTTNDMVDPGKNPFTIPDNFFERFHEEMMAKLPQKEVKKRHFTFRRQILPWLGAAAVMSGIFFTVKDTVFTHHKATMIEMTSDEGQQTKFVSSDDRDFYEFIKDEDSQKQFRKYYGQ